MSAELAIVAARIRTICNGAVSFADDTAGLR